MNKAFINLPYKIGASSMIFGNDVVENATLLAKVVDHVEIILFHTPAIHNIPSREEIRRLIDISQQHKISYSVHLPTSLEFGSPWDERRKESVAMVSDICFHMSDLDPVHFVMHIPFSPPALVPIPGLYFKSGGTAQWDLWTKRSLESLNCLHDVMPKSFNLLIENINYSPLLLKPFTHKGLCALCLDIGHLILGNESVIDHLMENFALIREIHIHGVRGYHDHLCVSELPESILNQCFQHLNDQMFDGVVNLEVFTPQHLDSSLSAISNALKVVSTMDNHRII